MLKVGEVSNLIAYCIKRKLQLNNLKYINNGKCKEISLQLPLSIQSL